MSGPILLLEKGLHKGPLMGIPINKFQYSTPGNFSLRRDLSLLAKVLMSIFFNYASLTMLGDTWAKNLVFKP